MSRINQIGILLLLAVFGLASWRMAERMWRGASHGGEGVLLRFAHVTIHPGIIRAYDEAIRDYEKLHPGVRIEQVPVPLRVWPAWLRTQMIGGTGPDLADMDRGQPDEFLARFFLPFDPWLDDANPYNAGTPLEGLSWRRTFVDGLSNRPGYRPGLQQVFGIPLTVATIRVFANADLMREVGGGDAPPRDYGEFMKLCEAVDAYSRRTGRPIVALAGSSTHTLPLLTRLFSSQTQTLSREINPRRTLALRPRDAALAYLRGDWSWRTPAVADGLELIREVGRHTVEGFVQLQREDSLFHYSQGRALMLATGSWEADTLMAEAPFRHVVFPIPIPRAGEGRFGANVLGPPSELAVSPGNAVGVSRGTRHPEIAVDFLRFLTSRDVSRKVMGDSNRLSATAGVEPPESIAAFAPMAEGYPAGFGPEFSDVSGTGAGDAARIYRSYLHELVSLGGSVEGFTRTMEARFGPAVTADLRHSVRDSARNGALEDAILAAARLGPDQSARSVARRLRMMEAQTQRELDAAEASYVLRTAGRNRGSAGAAAFLPP